MHVTLQWLVSCHHRIRIVRVFGIILMLCFPRQVSRPFKADRYLYVPPVLTTINASFCTYLFRMVLTINVDYFLEQY
jgi:hypothetical protein